MKASIRNFISTRLFSGKSTRTSQASPLVAAAIAITSLVVAKSLSSSENQKKSKKDGHRGTIPQQQLISSSLSSCLCEQRVVAGNKPSRGRFLPITRKETIQRIDRESTKNETLRSRYDINWFSKPLGEGAFGSVYLGTKNDGTKEKVAVKQMSKKCTDDESFLREMRALLHIMSCGGHPNICSLQEHFDEGSYYYLIIDLVAGGEMFDHLIRNGAYSEADAARLVREVASALAFLHGIGIVHADMKPENIMLSTEQSSDAVVKLVDFGCAQVLEDEENFIDTQGSVDNSDSTSSVAHARTNTRKRSFVLTAAYCPPEAFKQTQIVEPPMDMWSLGVILYIMLCGCHPFDLTGETPDEMIEKRIKDPRFYSPPIRDTRYTEHLSNSAIDLIEKLIERDPEKRLTADEMLEHPWVRGETATTNIIAGSDERLNKLMKIKSKLQAKFFADVVTWSDDEETRRKTSLIERSFQSFNTKNQPYLNTKDLMGDKFDDDSADSNDNTDEGGSISIGDYQDLLSENMKNKYFPKGHVVYREGDIGNHMYFINSGTIEVTTKDGSRASRKQGDFFGEGALLHPKKIRSATIKCRTPVHAMEISREYFEKYLASSESGLALTLREKDKIRKRNRAKTILKLQQTLKDRDYSKGDYLYKWGEEGDSLFILQSGKLDVLVKDHPVFSVNPGNLCGEHSLLTGLPRNTSAVCVADDGCKAAEMMGRDFRKLMDVSPNMKDSLYDLCLRRDFKKAVVFRLKKEFPYDNPLEAFNVADMYNRGVLDVDSIGNLMREMDDKYTDEQVQEVIKALSLTRSGTVTFDEFKKVFIADIRASASI